MRQFNWKSMVTVGCTEERSGEKRSKGIQVVVHVMREAARWRHFETTPGGNCQHVYNTIACSSEWCGHGIAAWWANNTAQKGKTVAGSCEGHGGDERGPFASGERVERRVSFTWIVPQAKCCIASLAVHIASSWRRTLSDRSC